SGKVAQYVTVMQPQRVLGQVLLGPAAAMEFALSDEMKSAWLDYAGAREPTRRALAFCITVPVKPELMEAFLDDFVKVPRIALEETLNMIAGPSFLDQVKAISAPTLVIGGTQDPLFPPAYLEQYVVSPIPAARLALLPCGHEI